MFNKQTTLDLDGPKLGFGTDPQDTVNAGMHSNLCCYWNGNFSF